MRKRWIGDVIKFAISNSDQLELDSTGMVRHDAFAALLVQEYRRAYKSMQARLQPHRAGQNAVVKAGFDMRFDK